MKYILSFVLIFFFSSNLFSKDVFNPILIDRYNAKDSQSAIEYLNRKLNPKFPKDTHINIENITLLGEAFKMITFYYSEYDGATRGESKYFISFWKDNKEYLTCIGSNMLNIYDPVITISNNIINIKGFKVYEPLSTYYYSFIYDNSFIMFHSIMQISTDADNNTKMQYYYSQKDTSINIYSIFADELIKKYDK